MIDPTSLYALVALSLAYLIYRYHRYSRWWKSDVGRAFMLMKCCLLLLSLYGMANVWILNGPLEDAARLAVVGSILIAVVYQIAVVVRSQGGFRRRTPVKPTGRESVPPI